MNHNWGDPMGGFQAPQATQHHHHAHQNQTTGYLPTPDQEIAVARSQMFESVHHLSAALRNAANQCDNFVKVVARHHPSAAATAFASNVGADFLALASGATLGAGALAAHAPGLLKAPGTPGRKPMSKEEKRALRKERKLNRDPNAPKRPPSAYLLFQNEIREDMRQQFKDLAYSEVLGKISEAWKNLTEEQRKVYQDRTTDNMARWHQDKRSHNQVDGEDGEEAAGIVENLAAIAAAAGGGADQDAQDAAAAGADLLASGNGVVEKSSRKGVKGEKRSRKN